MRVRVALVALVASLSVAVGAVAVASSADSVARVSPGDHAVQYSVKFVCGFYSAGLSSETVKPGNYATAINIHNYSDLRTFGRWRTDLHYALGSPAPPRMPTTYFAIASRTTGTINCGTIWSAIGVPPGTFIEGSIYLGTDVELPVRAVYTAQTDINPAVDGPDAGAGISIDVEIYEPLVSIVF